MERPFKKFVPGMPIGQISAGDMNRALRAAEIASRQDTGGLLTGIQDVTGGNMLDARPQDTWARILPSRKGGVDVPGTNPYAWEEVIFDESDQTGTDSGWRATGTLGGTITAILTLPGNTVSGSPIITGLISTSQLRPGLLVTGTGIPNGATIASVDSANQITLFQDATATSGPGGTDLTFWEMSVPLYEVNDNGNLTAATIVKAWPDPQDARYLCEVSASAASGIDILVKTASFTVDATRETLYLCDCQKDPTRIINVTLLDSFGFASPPTPLHFKMINAGFPNGLGCRVKIGDNSLDEGEPDYRGPVSTYGISPQVLYVDQDAITLINNPTATSEDRWRVLSDMRRPPAAALLGGNDASHTVSDETWTNVFMNTVLRDNAGITTPGPFALIRPPRPGNYAVHASLIWTWDVPDHTFLRIQGGPATPLSLNDNAIGYSQTGILNFVTVSGVLAISAVAATSLSLLVYRSGGGAGTYISDARLSLIYLGAGGVVN